MTRIVKVNIIKGPSNFELLRQFAAGEEVHFCTPTPLGKSTHVIVKIQGLKPESGNGSTGHWLFKAGGGLSGYYCAEKGTGWIQGPAN